MRTIGIIGGMSWESTVTYYQEINEAVREELGGLHSAKILMYSVDFAPIERLQSTGDWAENAEILADIARRLELAGADVILIGANTMHKVAPEVAAAVHIPVLHIADALAEEVKAQGISCVGLLGTRFTMEEPFIKDMLAAQGIEAIVPEGEDFELVDRVIYDELCVGQIREESRAAYADIMARLVERGAEGIVFGCTEVGLLVSQEDSPVPVFDTTPIHARAAVRFALERESSS